MGIQGTDHYLFEEGGQVKQFQKQNLLEKKIVQVLSTI